MTPDWTWLNSLPVDESLAVAFVLSDRRVYDLAVKKTGALGVVEDVVRNEGELLGDIERVYRDRYPAFLRVAVGITGDEQLGSEAVQDAFVRVVRSRHTIRKRGALEAFVWTAVVNAARDRGIVRAETSEPPDLAAFEAAKADERVRHAIAELPERQRLVLFLRYFADLDYEAIARVMQVRPGTVGAALNAARAAVKRTLEREEAA